MFNKYKDERHQEQAHEFLKELGEFVLSFERVCENMRHAIMFMLRSQGLNNQDMAFVIVGDKTSSELQVLFGALFMEMPNQDEDDKKCVKELLKRIKKITEQRNILLHSAWDLGHQASWDKEILAVATRFRTKQNTGADIQPHGVNPSYLRELGLELTSIQVLVERLLYCISQPQFKVSTELNKEI